MHRYELTDAQWEKIQGLCAGKAGDAGRRAADNRLFINAMLFIARSGCPWRDLPPRYGRWNTVYQRFRRWTKSGRWQRILEALVQSDSSGDTLGRSTLGDTLGDTPSDGSAHQQSGSLRADAPKTDVVKTDVVRADVVMIDSTSIRVHQHASGQKKTMPKALPTLKRASAEVAVG